jgi:hypothetical protein
MRAFRVFAFALIVPGEHQHGPPQVMLRQNFYHGR